VNELQVDVLSLQGKNVKKIDLPDVFKEKLRQDLIERTILALQSHRRQPYGTDPIAGLRSSAHFHGRRRVKHTMQMRDIARMPRIHDGPSNLYFRARKVPQSVKGRRTHPPKVEKDWYQKINEKERRLALRSSIAATANKEIVSRRGHMVNLIELPIVIEDSIQSIKKTKDVENLLLSLKLDKELDRIKIKKVRSGKGKMRGRKYRIKKGPLIVVSEDKGISKACNNIPGIDVRNFKTLSVEDLAPGANPGRLTIWSKSSIEKLSG
jgi:large subunit ribosomal protein L4e